jgi:hypothetical protein
MRQTAPEAYAWSLRMEGFSRAFPELTIADVRSGFCLTRPEYSIGLPTDSTVSACALYRRHRFEHHARGRGRKSDFRCWHFSDVARYPT